MSKAEMIEYIRKLAERADTLADACGIAEKPLTETAWRDHAEKCREIARELSKCE